MTGPGTARSVGTNTWRRGPWAASEQCRPALCSRTKDLNLQAATTRLQDARRSDPMLLSRPSRMSLVLVAGGDVNVVSIYHRLGLPTVN